jgi:hypothetical protein
MSGGRREFGEIIGIVLVFGIGDLMVCEGTLMNVEGTLMKIITLHPLVIVVEGRNSDTRGVCGSAVVKVIQKMESGDRDS